MKIVADISATAIDPNPKPVVDPIMERVGRVHFSASLRPKDYYMPEHSLFQ